MIYLNAEMQRIVNVPNALLDITTIFIKNNGNNEILLEPRLTLVIQHTKTNKIILFLILILFLSNNESLIMIDSQEWIVLGIKVFIP